APSPDLAQFLAKNPNVRVTARTPEWWATQKKPRHRTHQLRQSWVATHCYHNAHLDWLAHIDIDEFLLPTDDIAHSLAEIPPSTQALRLPPVCCLATPMPRAGKIYACLRLSPRPWQLSCAPRHRLSARAFIGLFA
ncbi:MAG: hypothetical protein EBR73_07325, partial [Rhodobacteraceae bacterium]|nr:hypothetical protein [Paracoccaceae bacterium]